MNILLVEPNYHRFTIGRMRQKSIRAKERLDDETLWYPPLGLMKLSRYHKDRGDFVQFVYGCDESVLDKLWDRVYITTLFTYGWEHTIKTVLFYKNATGGVVGNIYIGGIMATIMAEEIFEVAGIYPICGLLDSAQRIGFSDNTNIDTLPPDYDLLDGQIYATNDTYYGYTSRGCVNKCGWCAVPKLEPSYIPYIDIKPSIRRLRQQYGDKAKLKLMDNNILASPELDRIVEDLCLLGYSKDSRTNIKSLKKRVIDFNQGLDATFVNDKTMRLLSKLNVSPFRIAFDRAQEKQAYLNAIRIAKRYGFKIFSNYMLYNWHDSPKDLYDRLVVNINLNSEWRDGRDKPEASVYSYPMRYAPIRDDERVPHANRYRDLESLKPEVGSNLLEKPLWTRRFIRNVEIMKGAVHGAISTTPGLAKRTIGRSFEEFIANLYMPEVLLRNRNKYEKKVYKYEPKRCPGSGKIEEFRVFILKLLKRNNSTCKEFHEVVSKNRRSAVRAYIKRCKDKEVRKWLNLYLIK